MSTLHKMTKTQVIAHVKKYGNWSGVVCANKMYPLAQTTINLDLVWNNDRGVCVKDRTVYDSDINPVAMTLDHWLNNWSFYNTSSEEGTYVHFYRIVE